MDWMEITGRLRAAVALGLAMGGPGCGPVGDTDRETTDGTGSGSTAASNTTTSTSGNTAAPNTTSGDNGPKFDIAGDLFDAGERVKFDIGPTGSDCEPELPRPECEPELNDFEVVQPYCIDVAAGTSCDQVEDEVLDTARLCLGCRGFAPRVACEPFAVDTTSCCAWIVVEPGQSCPGRPFLVEGIARVPAVVRRDDWSRRCSPNLAGLSPSTRSVLSQAWAAEGCHEAASVASFSRFVLQLISLGAPSSLIAKAQAAMADEVEHARTFFGLALAYGGVSLGPDALSIEGSLDEASAPVASAVSLATEGCIAETVSAMQLGLAASRATDPEIAALLSEIAEQELRHAELAWSALAWMLQRGDDALRAAVANAFSRAQDAVPRAVSISDALDPKILSAGGRLTAAQRLDVAQRALASCVAPAAATLFQPWTMTAAPPGEVMTPRPAVPARA